MSDFVLCPVCETENALDATHCEVCGERLVAAAEGEEVAPEESVSSMIAEEATSADTEFVAEEVEEGGFGLMGGSDILYSPLTGEAYHPGSPEFEEGFGPMGEELVPTPPESLPEADLIAPEESEATGSGFDHEYADDFATDNDEGTEVGNESETDVPLVSRASAAFQAAFPIKEKAKPALEPLPVPGTSSATLTLYVNKAPVHTYSIETDETLIGRRDPRADAFPEFDLSEWDPDAHVSRKHAYLYRQNKNYTLYVVSNSGTQVNSDLLNLGDRRALKSGDVIILAGRFAMKFEIPDA